MNVKIDTEYEELLFSLADENRLTEVQVATMLLNGALGQVLEGRMKRDGTWRAFYLQRWRRRNPKKSRSIQARYREKNLEKVRTIQRDWVRKNAAKIAAQRKARRLRGEIDRRGRRILKEVS